MGVTFLKLHNFSISNIERSLEGIKLEFKAPPARIKKSVIQKFNHNKEKEEFNFTSIINIPIKRSEAMVENGELKIRERKEYSVRNIEAVIRLKTQTVVVFSQGQKEVRGFSKFLKEITLKGFYPVPTKLDQEGLRKMTTATFDEVRQLKISRNIDNGAKSITFRGKNLLGDDSVLKILSNDAYEIHGVEGIVSLPSDNLVRLYLNHRGRMLIWSDPEILSEKDFYDLIQKVEKIQSFDEV